ncbi:type II secretion system protein GspE [Pseudodesulfovibrio nedwellii]|uniref:protein-secreting ATPase n=1 Tax=Pseudodesulfovibrio nedwellii TaxID=2973072 RepID=A0ABM8B3R3_9BACT|nr:type II secretion system ATPase GspE [Pseudodesulfovibrio nedwellii]BDQ38455.1 type II secretion system protein GspE [Pseudodesulfovibrio nedwellii]
MLDFSVENALVASGHLSDEEVHELGPLAQEQDLDLPEFLLKKGRISESDITQFYARFYDKQYFDSFETSWILPELIRKFTIHYLKRFNAVPLKDKDGNVFVAISRPEALNIINDFHLTLDSESITPIFAPSQVVLGAINQVFGDVEEDMEAIEVLEGADVDSFSMLDDDKIEDLLDDTSDAPFIKLVNMILSQAVRANASDVHVEPYKDILRVRFRLDGVLYDKHSVSKKFHAALVSRIKIMAKLNIAEKRLPQDGRIALSLGGRQVDLRVSILPTGLGERIVMRLLEKSTEILNMPELGLTDQNLDRMKRLVKISHGIILVTGPTGSGKTTSLYSVLNYINSPDKNILTIEDPVEYQLDGIGQIQVNSKIGLDFSSGLRSIVRQDPDVVLIGEIRDGETAEIAIQAALTGHLVFSTLHTNDAPSAVTRLIDMGVEPFLLSSVLRAVVAQRLVRRLCSECKEAYVPNEEQLATDFGKFADEFRGLEVYRAVGCENCMGTGYKGRMAIYEIMELSEATKSLVLNTADSNQLRKQAKADGMDTLTQNGVFKTKLGLTTLTEVLRVTNL